MKRCSLFVVRVAVLHNFRGARLGSSSMCSATEDKELFTYSQGTVTVGERIIKGKKLVFAITKPDIEKV